MQNTHNPLDYVRIGKGKTIKPMRRENQRIDKNIEEICKR